MGYKIQAIFDAVDNISKVANGIAGNLGKLEGVSKKVGKTIAAGFAVGAGAAIAFGASSIKIASEFQSQLAIMSTATKDFGVDMGTLREVSLTVGGDVSLIGVSATGAADAITGLAKAGLSSNEVFGDMEGYLAGTAELGGALRASIDLAAASELDMVQASDLAAVSLATFGGEMESEADRAQFVNDAMDNIVKAADASVASVSGLAEALKNVGPTAASFGFSIQDTNNALAILSTRGIEGAEAGTALKSMMTNLMRPTDAVKDTLREMNVSLFDSAGNMKSLPTIIGDLENAMAGMTQEQQLATITTLAGTYGMKAMATLVGEGTAGWNAMAEATENAAGIQEQAAAKSATFAGKMEALEGVIETIQIRVGEALLPVLSRFVDWAAEMATNRGPELVAVFTNIASVMDTLVSAFIGIVEWLMKLDESQIKVVAGLALLVAGIAPVISIVSTLAGVFGALVSGATAIVAGIGGLALALSEVGAGLALIQGGGGVFAVASTGAAGLTAALLPVVVALGAVTAAYLKWRDVQGTVAEGTSQVQDAWGNFFDEQVASGASASAVLDAYRGKQALVREELDKGGIAADLLIRNQGNLINSDRDLAVAVARTATGYREFLDVMDEAGVEVDISVETFERLRSGTSALSDSVGGLAGRLLEAGRGAMVMAQGAAVMAKDATASDERMLAFASSASIAADAVGDLTLADAEAATTGLELTAITDMLAATYETMGTEASMVAARTQAVDLAMGTTSNATVKLNSDMQLVSSAFAEGTLSLEAYADYAGQAEAGTLDLSNAQIAGISGAMEHAAASRIAAQAADEYRLSMLSLSESLKDAGAQQAAQIALGGLEEKFTAGLLSLDQYEAAVISVQDAYGLATPQSRALAEGMTALNDMLAAGLFAPAEYAAAVEAMRLAAEGGESSVEGLLGAAEAVVGPLGAASNAAIDAGDKFSAIEEGANRATAALGAMTAKDWIVQVGASGTLPPGVQPIACATGAWNIPDEMLALLHPGEMVLPKDLADAVRGGQSGGSRREGDVTNITNYNLSYAAYQQGSGNDTASQQMREIEVAAKLRR